MSGFGLKYTQSYNFCVTAWEPTTKREINLNLKTCKTFDLNYLTHIGRASVYQQEIIHLKKLAVPRSQDIDKSLRCDTHIDNCKKIASGVFLLRQIKDFYSVETVK